LRRRFSFGEAQQEAAMADKPQMGQKDRQSGQQQQGNLGQKEAQQEKKGDAKMERMGEGSGGGQKSQGN
jgi:hypothetical protein